MVISKVKTNEEISTLFKMGASALLRKVSTDAGIELVRVEVSQTSANLHRKWVVSEMRLDADMDDDVIESRHHYRFSENYARIHAVEIVKGLQVEGYMFIERV